MFRALELINKSGRDFEIMAKLECYHRGRAKQKIPHGPT